VRNSDLGGNNAREESPSLTDKWDDRLILNSIF
jgi:hypothetical protein